MCRVPNRRVVKCEFRLRRMNSLQGPCACRALKPVVKCQCCVAAVNPPDRAGRGLASMCLAAEVYNACRNGNLVVQMQCGKQLELWPDVTW